MKLNAKERKILYELSKNARLSASKIAAKTGVSKDVAVYTIKKFLRNKTIKKLVTLIDTESLGFARYEVYFKLENIGKEKHKEMLDYLTKHPMFMWVRSSLGDWEIASEFYARNVHEYEDILREVRNNFSSNIKKMDSVAVTYEHCFPLKCIGYKEEELPIEKRALREIKIDNEDFKILKNLSINARTNVVDIAKGTKLSPDAVIYRIKNLIKKKVILGYRVTIDEKMLGLQKFKVLLKLKNVDDKTYAKLLEFLKLQKSTQYIKRSVGVWDFSVTLLAKDIEELRNIIFDMKSELKEALDDYKILLLFEEYKNTYFPEGIAK